MTTVHGEEASPRAQDISLEEGPGYLLRLIVAGACDNKVLMCVYTCVC